MNWWDILMGIFLINFLNYAKLCVRLFYNFVQLDTNPALHYTYFPLILIYAAHLNILSFSKLNVCIHVKQQNCSNFFFVPSLFPTWISTTGATATTLLFMSQGKSTISFWPDISKPNEPIWDYSRAYKSRVPALVSLYWVHGVLPWWEMKFSS